MELRASSWTNWENLGLWVLESHGGNEDGMKGTGVRDPKKKGSR